MTGWTRAELKSRAKGCLRIYYWPAFAVSLILAVVTGGWTSGSSAGGGTGEGYIGGSFELSLPELLGILMVLVSMLLMLIPCVNIVLMFVWAFSSREKRSKSNYFKATLIFAAIILVIYIIFIAIFGVAISSAIANANF